MVCIIAFGVGDFGGGAVSDTETGVAGIIRPFPSRLYIYYSSVLFASCLLLDTSFLFSVLH